MFKVKSLAHTANVFLFFILASTTIRAMENGTELCAKPLALGQSPVVGYDAIAPSQSLQTERIPAQSGWKSKIARCCAAAVVSFGIGFGGGWGAHPGSNVPTIPNPLPPTPVPSICPPPLPAIASVTANFDSDCLPNNYTVGSGQPFLAKPYFKTSGWAYPFGSQWYDDTYDNSVYFDGEPTTVAAITSKAQREMALDCPGVDVTVCLKLVIYADPTRFYMYPESYYPDLFPTQYIPGYCDQLTALNPNCNQTATQKKPTAAQLREKLSAKKSAKSKRSKLTDQLLNTRLQQAARAKHAQKTVSNHSVQQSNKGRTR